LHREVESLTSENQRLIGHLDEAIKERTEMLEKHAYELHDIVVQIIVTFFNIFIFYFILFFTYLLNAGKTTRIRISKGAGEIFV
jgi:hypothetical protein